MTLRPGLTGMFLALAVAGAGASGASSTATTASVAAERRADGDRAVSASAQRAYETARDKLLQVRTLLKDQDSQSSVGSGFIVSGDGLVITNYHVVSQVALQPQRYRLTYTRTGGVSGTLQLLAFDAVHDLALARIAPAESQAGARPGADAGNPGAPSLGSLGFRPQALALANGERIYSLGNPLDIGFAVVEGNYNGMVARSFYPQILFSGALSPGMSGGPALDGQGRVIGVNVATRLDGQQVSFLVPAQFAQDLLDRGRSAPPIVGPVYAELTRQLEAHQALLVQRLLAQSWRSDGNLRYRIPVPQEDFMRCWGSSSRAETKSVEFQSSDCQMEGALFISDQLRTGTVTVRHETYEGGKLGALRFAHAYTDRFRAKRVGGGAATTVPECKEGFSDLHGMPARTVVCLSAYRKLHGLFDLTVLVATVDATTQGVQGRMDARGIDFDNALRLVDHYLNGFGWNGSH
jgi:serine protease Do